MVRKRMEEKFYENSLFLDFLYDMVLAQHLPDVGILSLTGNCTNILLWAHYADSHKGCCLEFSSTTDRIFANAQQVKYHEEYPKLDFKKCLQNPDALVEATILSKSSLWYYEEEWRTHSPEGPGLYKFKPESLTGIILGYTMPQEQQDLLKRLAEVRVPKVKLFRAFPKHREFEMEIIPI